MMHVSVSIVRTAGPEDEEGIMGLCRRLHAENGLFRMDEDRVRGWVHSTLCPAERPNGLPPGLIGVIGAQDELEAVIILMVSNFWYAAPDDQHLEEFLTYVPPEYRKSEHAKSLIGFAKSCSDALAMPLLIGVMSNHRMEAKVRLYRRQLPKLGEFFMYPAREAN